MNYLDLHQSTILIQCPFHVKDFEYSPAYGALAIDITTNKNGLNIVDGIVKQCGKIDLDVF